MNTHGTRINCLGGNRHLCGLSQSAEVILCALFRHFWGVPTQVLVIVALTTFACNAQKPLDTIFVNAIHHVEDNGGGNNDNGQALGPLQIHYDYWLDSGISGKYSDCADYGYSVKVMTGYLNRFGARFIRAHNYEALARIHNGGPKGYQKQSTLPYWKKVKKFLTSKQR